MGSAYSGTVSSVRSKAETDIQYVFTVLTGLRNNELPVAPEHAPIMPIMSQIPIQSPAACICRFHDRMQRERERCSTPYREQGLSCPLFRMAGRKKRPCCVPGRGRWVDDRASVPSVRARQDTSTSKKGYAARLDGDTVHCRFVTVVPSLSSAFRPSFFFLLRPNAR